MRRLHAQSRNKTKQKYKRITRFSLSGWSAIESKNLGTKENSFQWQKKRKKTKPNKLFTVWWHRQFRVVVIVNPGWPFRVGNESWLEFCFSPGNILKKEKLFVISRLILLIIKSSGSHLSLSRVHTQWCRIDCTTTTTTTMAYPVFLFSLSSARLVHSSSVSH
jgi:hypothetical protein